jgi:patatin-related protein
MNAQREPNSILLTSTTETALPTGGFDVKAAPLFRRTLRIALAMRGGISLAVWIGGAVAELDILRRIRWVQGESGSGEECYLLWPASRQGAADRQVIERARVYADALRARGYDRVEFDVLAGASAGGLNGVLYGVAQRVGAGLDSVLQTWLEHGALWNLLRPPGLLGVDSVLDGDGYFARHVNVALINLYEDKQNDQVESHRAPRVVIDLAATLMDREDARDRGSREGRAHFHFVGADHGARRWREKEQGRAVPAPPAYANRTDPVPPEVALALARLAYSSRSTSSLPGVFEPALIYSSYLRDAVPPAGAVIDMSMAFNLHRQGLDAPFRVFDGGLLDNIPIDRAFRAIRAMASETYADRAVFYLDPDPPATGSRRPPRGYDGRHAPATLTGVFPKRTDRSSFLISAVTRGYGNRLSAESGQDEADAIDAFRRELALAQGRDASMAPLSAAAAKPGYSAEFALAQYTIYREHSDTNLLARVLKDPATWQLGTDLLERHSFPAASGEGVQYIQRDLGAAYAAARSGATPHLAHFVFTGPNAQIDCCLSLLAWVRALEDAAFASAPQHESMAPNTYLPQFVETRRSLYDSLDEATLMRDRILLRVCIAALAEDEQTVALAPDELSAAATSAFATLADDERAQLLEIAAKLDRIATQLASGTLQLRDTAIAQTLWAGLPAGRDATALQVAALCAARGIPEALSDVRFWPITAEQLPARMTEFDDLSNEQLRTDLRSILAVADGEDLTEEVARLVSPSHLSPQVKLTGTTLQGFAGFLARDWRKNDWLWGRLDAAASVLAFLDASPVPGVLDTAAYGARPGAPTREQQVEGVQDAILTEAALTQGPRVGKMRGAPFDPPPTESASARDLRRLVRLGPDSIGSLEPGYRVGIASRAVHLAVRGATRWRSGLAAHAAAFILRPLLSVAPVAVDPARALVVLVLLLGVPVVALTSPVDVPTDPQGVARSLTDSPGWTIALVLCAIVAFFTVRGLFHARDAWQRIETAIGKFSEPAASGKERALSMVRSYRRSALQRSVITGVAGLALIVAGVVTGLSALLPVWGSIGLVFVGVCLMLGAGAGARSVRSPAGYGVRNAVVMAIAGVLLLILLLVPGVLSSFVTAVSGWLGQATGVAAPQPLLVGLTSLTVYLVTTWGWQVGRFPADGVTKSAVAAGAALWLAYGMLCGVIGYIACALALGIEHRADQDVLIDVIAVLTGLFAAGYAQWFLLEFPGPYEPRDLTKRPELATTAPS